MDKPTMYEPYSAAPDIEVLPAYFPLPGLGILPVNSFILRAAEPVLVDTGLAPLSTAFIEKLLSIIDPADLKWLWLTHTDQDHIGSLKPILKLAPKLRIITTYLGAGKMSLYDPLPLDRVYFLNPGQSIDVGDRLLTAVRPPTFDAPETTGFFDPKTAAFFSADCFGALMTVPAQYASDIGSGALKEGLSRWATVDAPWLHMTDRGSFNKALDSVRSMSPRLIVSSHLPPSEGMAEQLLGYLAEAPGASPFMGPDQEAFESMMKGHSA